MAESYEHLRRLQEEEKNLPAKKVTEFSKANNITSDELFFAYQIALGVPPNELETDVPLREEVFQLAQMIGTFTKDGYPLNRISDLVEGKMLYEHAQEDFEAMVDGMKLSAGEKKLLKKMVNKEREGNLFIYDKSTGKEIVHFSITEASKQEDYTTNDFALELMDVLDKARLSAKNQEIEVQLES
jgi:hypothetical protein